MTGSQQPLLPLLSSDLHDLLVSEATRGDRTLSRKENKGRTSGKGAGMQTQDFSGLVLLAPGGVLATVQTDTDLT